MRACMLLSRGATVTDISHQFVLFQCDDVINWQDFDPLAEYLEWAAVRLKPFANGSNPYSRTQARLGLPGNWHSSRRLLRRQLAATMQRLAARDPDPSGMIAFNEGRAAKCVAVIVAAELQH